MNGINHTLECAIHALAPICANCGVRIVGHGIERTAPSSAATTVPNTRALPDFMTVSEPSGHPYASRVTAALDLVGHPNSGHVDRGSCRPMSERKI